jgi:CubicO group peptidase (beta-lactamase class C family)
MPRSEILARLRHLEPSKPFRSTFQYNNLMYMAAGVLAERLAGVSWEELVRRRLFEPIGMKSANYSVEDAGKSGDWALSYGEGGREIPPTRSVESICPAGCINANLEEMTRYLQFHLGRGSIGGMKVMAPTQLERMLVPTAFVPAGGFGPEALGPTAYGLGLDIAQYRGHRLAFHTGTIGGYHALLSFLPGDGIGVVVLQNRVARAVPQLLSFSIYDRLLGLERTGWTKHFAESDAAQKAKTDAEKRAAEGKRKPGTQPSHELSAYAGVFRHAAYGDLHVERKGGALEAAFGGQPARQLTHFHYDVFVSGEQQTRARFLSNGDGEIDQVAIRLEPAVNDIVFERIKP